MQHESRRLEEARDILGHLQDAYRKFNTELQQHQEERLRKIQLVEKEMERKITKAQDEIKRIDNQIRSAKTAERDAQRAYENALRKSAANSNNQPQQRGTGTTGFSGGWSSGLRK
jgi:vacuolar-type H+-ATPase subunit I/STV1